MLKLREYEIQKLKYFFAIAQCDSPETAKFLYEQLDGYEFELTNMKLDIRVVPDSIDQFPNPPRDVAIDVPKNFES